MTHSAVFTTAPRSFRSRVDSTTLTAGGHHVLNDEQGAAVHLASLRQAAGAVLLGLLANEERGQASDLPEHHGQRHARLARAPQTSMPGGTRARGLSHGS